MIPLPSIQGVDDLIAAAKRGALAGNALDIVKATLAEMRDKKYRELLNAPSDRTVELKYELKAIEGFAQALLAKEMQGELAHDSLQSMVGNAPSRATPTVLAPEKQAPRKRSSRARGTTGK